MVICAPWGYTSSLLISNQTVCIDDMRIVGQWCYTPCTYAKETLDSFP